MGLAGGVGLRKGDRPEVGVEWDKGIGKEGRETALSVHLARDRFLRVGMRGRGALHYTMNNNNNNNNKLYYLLEKNPLYGCFMLCEPVHNPWLFECCTQGCSQ